MRFDFVFFGINWQRNDVFKIGIPIRHTQKTKQA